MNTLVPPINLKGIFKIKAPLDTILNPHIYYTVLAVESIKKLLLDNIDVKAVMYKAQGLSDESYEHDLINDIPITTLKTEAGELFYIPTNLIRNMPEATGVVYKQKAIVLNLGYVNDSVNADFVGTEIKDIVSALTGIDVVSSVEDISGSYVLGYEENDVREASRISKIKSRVTCKAKLLKCNNILETYKVKMAALVERFKVV